MLNNADVFMRRITQNVLDFEQHTELIYQQCFFMYLFLCLLLYTISIIKNVLVVNNDPTLM